MAEINPPASGPFTAEGSPSLQQLVDYFVERLYHPDNLARLQAAQANAASRGMVIADAVLDVAKSKVGWDDRRGYIENIVKIVISATDIAEPFLDPITRGAIESLLKEGGEARRVGDTAGGRLLQKLAGSATSVEPSLDGAARYMTLFLNESVEALLRSVTLEIITEFGPEVFGVGGGIENLQKLQEVIEHALGGDRMVRRVLQPIVSATAITPAQWYANKRYRPELLSVGAATEAFLRGDYTDAELREELARQGWSEKRIDVTVENARKRLTFDELLFRHYVGEISDADVARDARTLGYDEAVALQKVSIDNRKRIDDFNRPIITEAVTNFIAGDIEAPDMERWIRGAAANTTDAERIISTARARRAINVRRVTIAELRGLVRDGIASVADFRRRLQHDGFDPEAVTWFELQLRFDLDKATTIEDHRRQMEADRAAEKAQRDAAKAERDADVAVRKARAQFPPLADYRRGYVHGLIDRDALAAALTRDGIVEDQDLYLGDADLDREAYLANLEQRARATAKAAASDLSIAQREEAVLRGVISLDEFDADLRARQLDDGDRRVLTELLRLKVADREKADKERAAAQDRAKLTGASHADWIRAVRLGVRTVDQYVAWLTSIGVADVSRALLVDVVRAELAQDAAAAAKRAAADAAAAQKGLSLGERRRAVIAGVRPRDWYAAAIAKAGWPVDDQLADLALLDVETANAAAVRVRRDQLAAAKPDPTLSLAQVEAAFKLGLLTADEFVAMLRARHYSAADADMLRQLAVLTIPNVRGGQAAEANATPDQLGKPAPLGDVRRAVLRGIRTPADFEAELRARGFSEDAAALMREVLDEEISLDADTLRAKVASALAARADAPSLGELLDAFDTQTINAGELIDALAAFDIPRDVAVLVARTKAA